MTSATPSIAATIQPHGVVLSDSSCELAAAAPAAAAAPGLALVVVVVVAKTVVVVVEGVGVVAEGFVTVMVAGGSVTVVVCSTVFGGGGGVVVVTVRVVVGSGVVVESGRVAVVKTVVVSEVVPAGRVGNVPVGRLAVAVGRVDSVVVGCDVVLAVDVVRAIWPPLLPQLTRNPATKRASPALVVATIRSPRAL